jgi:hypothetical protein
MDMAAAIPNVSPFSYTGKWAFCFVLHYSGHIHERTHLEKRDEVEILVPNISRIFSVIKALSVKIP